MTSRIDRTFKKLREHSEKALITFITCGDPDYKTVRQLVLEMEKSGADIVELGVPFSDPLADGVTIQRSSQRALAKGVSLKGILEFVKDLRKDTGIPLVLMTYYNPVYMYSPEKFCYDASRAGVDGVIIPDLSPEEGVFLERLARKSGLDTIFLLAPTSGPDRIKIVSRLSHGFIYYVSLTGVTGVRSSLSGTLKTSVERIRTMTSKPVAVGFGISTPQQAHEVACYADGVIVGSALVNIIERHSKKKDLVKRVGKCVKELKNALRSNYGS